MYVLITGANSGIGKELANIYASKGYNLILVARDLERLNRVVSDLKTYNVDVLAKSYDLSILENCFTLFDEVKHLDISIFINNAGYGNLGSFTETSLNIEINMINLNIIALQTLTKLFVQNYNKGVVVNISSMAAFLPTPTFATYAATKAYVYNFSRAINYELKRAKKNIKVVTVNPGPIKTNFYQRANANINRGMDAKKCATIIYNGINKNKTFIIPGAAMKFTHVIMKFIPTNLLLKASYLIQKSK